MIVPAGDAMPYSMRLAVPSKILDIQLADGFELRSLRAGKRTFGPDLVMLEAPTEDRDNPKYFLRNYRILPSDDLALDIVNASDDDRLFLGALSYEPAPVIGQAAAPSPRPMAAARPTVPSNHAHVQAHPGATYSTTTRPVAPGARVGAQPPRSPGHIVDRLGHGRPAVPIAGRAFRTLTPGTNQVAILVSRRQAEILDRLARGERYISPLERQELTGPIRRALGRLTVEEEDAATLAADEESRRLLEGARRLAESNGLPAPSAPDPS